MSAEDDADDVLWPLGLDRAIAGERGHGAGPAPAVNLMAEAAMLDIDVLTRGMRPDFAGRPVGLVAREGRDGLDVGGDRLKVAVGEMGQTVVHDLRHGSDDDALSAGRAGLEILDQVVFRPAPNPLRGVGGDVRRIPVVDRAAREGLRVLRLHRKSLGRMAIAAMAEPFDKIGAAVPLVRLRRVRLEFARVEIESVPGSQTCPNVERKHQAIGFATASLDGATVFRKARIASTSSRVTFVNH